jgi:hypothetical protein
MVEDPGLVDGGTLVGGIVGGGGKVNGGTVNGGSVGGGGKLGKGKVGNGGTVDGGGLTWAPADDISSPTLPSPAPATRTARLIHSRISTSRSTSSSGGS